jgi:CheY-like chemotaxis protein
MSSNIVDLAILVALPEEFERLLIEFFGKGEVVRDPEYGNYYHRFPFLTSRKEPIDTIACFIGGMGPDRAGRQMERLLHRWSPRITAVVGICGAVNRNVSLCDVVVASRVDAYLATTKAIPLPSSRFDFEHRGIEYECDHELVEEARHLPFAHRNLYERWQEESSSRATKMLSGHVDELVRAGVFSHRPRVHTGCLASGPVVSAAVAFREWLLERNSQCTAIEMEAAGVVAASAERVSRARFIAIRGVSDLGDERKSNLDNLRAGAIRSVAMSNALGLLRTLADVGAFSRGEIPPQTDLKLLNSMSSPVGDASELDKLVRTLTTWMLKPVPTLSECKAALIGARILIVEDEISMVTFLSDLLTDIGAFPLTACNGIQALEILRSTSNIEIVLSDIVMADMDGIELAQHIAVELPKLPVVLMSGYTNSLNLDNCVAFLHKPFTLKKLLPIIADISRDEYPRSIINVVPELRDCFHVLHQCRLNVASFMSDFNGDGLFETAFRHKLRDSIAVFARSTIMGANPKLVTGRLSYEVGKLSTLLQGAKVRQRITLVEFVDTLINDTHKQFKAIELAIDLDPEISTHLESDAVVFICIALIEFVDNAVEALNKKGRITVALRRLELRQRIIMSVWSPTGPLNEELAAKIFEEGYSTKGPERGMGLSIIRKLAERFGGCVELSQDDGVEFNVILPYAQHLQ